MTPADAEIRLQEVEQSDSNLYGLALSEMLILIQVILPRPGPCSQGMVSETWDMYSGQSLGIAIIDAESRNK